MLIFDSICPLFGAGYGEIRKAQTPPHCISGCALYDEVHMQCSIRTIAQCLDLNTKEQEIPVSFEDGEGNT